MLVESASKHCYLFGTVHIKTCLSFAAVFYFYHEVLAVLLLMTAVINGAMPSLPVLLLCGALVATGIVSQLLAVRALTTLPVYCIAPLLVWQLLLLGVLGFLLKHFIIYSSPYSLYIVILLSFLSLIHLCLIGVVVSTIRYLTDKKAAGVHKASCKVQFRITQSAFNKLIASQNYKGLF